MPILPLDVPAEAPRPDILLWCYLYSVTGFGLEDEQCSAIFDLALASFSDKCNKQGLRDSCCSANTRDTVLCGD